MVFSWLSALRRGWLYGHRRRQLIKPRGRAGSLSERSFPALIQTLEPRQLLSASPAGTELAVNTFTTGGQSTIAGRSIAVDADGDFVVAWTDHGGHDGNGYGIFAQRFNAAGVAQGAEFRVNTYTLSNQWNPAVAMDADGDFVVAWQSSGQDLNNYGIYAQRFSAAGEAQGSEFRVNTFTTGAQERSTVAMDAAGNFVVAWQSAGQDGSGYGIYAQRFNAAGVAQDGEFFVNTFTTNSQSRAAVAMDIDGDFVVTWQSNLQDGSVYGIYAQRFDAAGVAQGSEFDVNTFTTSNQRFANVAMDLNGDFVITWSSSGQDGNALGVFAKRYNSAGVAQSGDLQVNATTTGDQHFSSVSVDADGDFVITWQSAGDGDGDGIFARTFNAAGVAQGGEVPVNTFTTGTQTQTSVAMDLDGDFVVAWTSDGQDGSGTGVFAQRFDESTNTAAPIVTGVYDADLGTNSNHAIVNGQVLRADVSGLVVAFSEDLVAGTVVPAAFQLMRNGVDVSSLITGVNFALNGTTGKYEAELTLSVPLSDGSYEFKVLSTITDLAGNKLDGLSNDGGFSEAYSQNFRIARPIAKGDEFRVNTFTAGNQQFSLTRGTTVAADVDGNFVVVWESSGQDGSGLGIFAQRYNAAGVAEGSEFQVNTTTAFDQFDASVAMDDDGDFVVVWVDNGPLGTTRDIYAQRYNAAGVAQGVEFIVNTTTTTNQAGGAVAMDADGDFVVAWNAYAQDGSNYAVYAQRFNASGTAQGGEFQVNTFTTNNQHIPAVAMNDAGDFVIAWESNTQDGSGLGIYGQRYDAAGTAQGSEFQISQFTTSNQHRVSVAMDADGDFLAVWQSSGQDGSSYGIYGRRYNSLGIAQGNEFRANTFTTNPQQTASVAMDADGDFVIAWRSLQESVTYGVYAQRFRSDGSLAGGEFKVNTFTSGAQQDPGVAMDADGDFVIAWESDNVPAQDGNGIGIFAQRYQASTRVVSVRANGAGDPIAPGQRLAGTVPADAAFVVTFDDDLAAPSASDFTVLVNGVAVGIDSVDYDAGQRTATINLVEDIVAGGVELIINGTATQLDVDGQAIDGDSNGTVGGDFSLAFAIFPSVVTGPEFQVNTFTTGLQGFSSVAMDADGDFVVTWMSPGQDGSSYGIFAQRYNAAGVAQGGEFQVNSFTTGAQQFSKVAMDADGDFVVTWSSFGQDGSDYGVYAQRYNAAGVAQGGEFRVNTFTTDFQGGSSVAMDADGDFVIMWESNGQDGSSSGIFAQRYNAAGVAQGGEFQVNTFTTGTQRSSAVAMDADGDFVIAWETFGQDGSGYGIYAQRYNAAGVAQGGEFQVNTFTTGTQRISAVAMDADGDFVVTWSSLSQDGDSYGIYAQRYNAAGVAQGGEFQVNSFTTSAQAASTVAMDADGDFVVTWHSNGQDGSSGGIFAQRYNAAGVAQGSEFPVNTFTTGSQSSARVALDADGDFVVTWTSNGQDGSGNGVFAQRFVRPKTEVSLSGGDLLVTAYDGPFVETLTITADNTNSRFVITDPYLCLTTTIVGATLSADEHTVFVPYGLVIGDQVIVRTFAGNDTITINAVGGGGVFSIGLDVDAGIGNDVIEIDSAVNSGSGAVSLTADTINLAANLSSDGGDISLNGAVVLQANVTIDTESGNNGNAGNVSLAGSVAGDNATRSLTIDTSSTAGAANGDVTIGSTFSTAAGTRLQNVTVSAFDTATVSGSVDASQNVTLTAFNADIPGTVNAGGTATVAPRGSGRAIDLGSENAARFSLTDGELDNITGAKVVVGNATSGAIIESATLSQAGKTLELVTGAHMTRTTGEIQADKLTLRAGTNIGSASIRMRTNVNNLEAAATSGSLFITEADAVTIGGANGIIGLSTGNPTGQISFISGNTMTVSEAVTAGGSGAVLLQTFVGDIGLGASVTTTGDASLVSGGAITRTAGSVAATNLTLNAITNIGTSGARVQTAVSRLEAIGGGAGIFVNEANSLEIGNANAGLTGISTRSGNTAVDISNTSGSIVVNEVVRSTGTGILNIGSASQLTINAGMASNGGKVTLSSAVSHVGVNAAVGSDSGTIAITAGLDVNLATNIIASTGTATLTAVGAITRTAGSIQGVSAVLDAGTTIGNGANRVTTLVTNLEARAGGNLFITEGNAVNIGGASGTLTGLSTTAANGSINLITGGAMTVNEAIAAHGTGAVTLQSYTGNVALNANVTTTGNATLSSGNALTHSTGAVSADQLTLYAVTSIGASTNPNRIQTSVNRLEALAQNGGIFITEANGIEVGGIASPFTLGLQTAGSSGDIELLVTAGALNITDGIRTHLNGVTRLRASSNVTQTGNLATMNGIISAALGVVSDSGTVNLSADNNDANHLAAAAASASQSVYFRDADDLFTNQVAAGGVFAGTVIGVMAAHDIELKASGYIGLEHAIQVGTGASDTVRLQSLLDAVGQTAQGMITGRNLSVQAGTAINLPANNDVDVFAAAAGVAPVIFNDPDGKTNGTVAGGVLITNSVTGVTP